MYADAIESYIRSIIESTQNNKLEWRPAEEFEENFSSIYESLWDRVCTIYHFEFSALQKEKSFFVKRNDSILMLLDYNSESGKDGSITHNLQLFGSLLPNSPVVEVPPYYDNGFIDLQNAILKYWQHKEGVYCLEVSDTFDLLSHFCD